MRISDNLKEIQPAATAVLDEIHREERNVAELTAALNRLTKATEAGYAKVDEIVTMDEHLAAMPGYQDEDPMFATAIYWDTYFGVDKERYLKNQELQQATDQLAAHDFARHALSGALLQFAKQGISLRYAKNLSACPEGRKIGTQCIRVLIWQGRNQAIHWEEGQFRSATQSVLQALEADMGSPFDQYLTRSLAYDFVSLFGWRSFADFSADLSSLDP